MSENERNRVTLSGRVVSPFKFSYKAGDKSIYSTFVAVERKSGVCDTIPIDIEESYIEDSSWKGKTVLVSGFMHSYNAHNNGHSRLLLSVMSDTFDFTDEVSDELNEIFLDGFICKKPIYRKTPFGRKITDLLVAVNSENGTSNYIPCIAWGKNAKFSAGLDVGTRIQLHGRIQSREYQKRISDEYEIRTAYEVSICSIEEFQCEESTDKD